jgi:excisionase family DNA binding protein
VILPRSLCRQLVRHRPRETCRQKGDSTCPAQRTAQTTQELTDPSSSRGSDQDRPEPIRSVHPFKRTLGRERSAPIPLRERSRVSTLEERTQRPSRQPSTDRRRGLRQEHRNPMKSPSTQFGMRENPAPQEQHGSHPAPRDYPGPASTNDDLARRESASRHSGNGTARPSNKQTAKYESSSGSPAIHTEECPLTVREAAKFLGVSSQTVYLWVERKQIPHLRVMGRNIRFLKSDLEPFRASFRQEMENG